MMKQVIKPILSLLTWGLFLLGVLASVSSDAFAQTSEQSPPSSARLPEPTIAGTLSLSSGKVEVSAAQLDLETVFVENASLRYAGEVSVTNDGKRSVVDFSTLSSGTYYVKGIHQGRKTLYKVVKP